MKPIDPKYKNAIFEGDHSRLHPDIEVRMSDLTIQVREQGRYEIDLERLTSSAEVLDFIFQVAEKTWCDPELCGQLVHAIIDATRRHFDESPQGVFCPWGRSTVVDWKKKTYTL